MGIKKLLPLLPGGSLFYSGFLHFRFQGERISVDIAGLLHECARNHAKSYLQGNYEPSLMEFYRTVVYIVFTLKWDVFIVFYGAESDVKGPEHARRESRRNQAENDHDKIRNDPLYIALAAKICASLHIQYIVAAEEADTQCVFSLIRWRTTNAHCHR